MIRFVLKHPLATFFSLLLHGGLAAIVFWLYLHTPSERERVANIPADQAVPEQTAKPVEVMQPMRTFTVDADLVQQQLQKIQQEELEKQRRAEQLRQQAEAEKQRLAELKRQQEKARQQALAAQQAAEAARKKAEALKQQQEAARQKLLAEQQRAQALKKAAEEAARKKAEAERKAQAILREKQLAEERKRQLEAELKRKAEEKRRLEEAAQKAKLEEARRRQQVLLQKQLLEEQQRRQQQLEREQLSKLRQLYISEIAAKVRENWRTPVKVNPEAACELQITQDQSGKILSVQVLNCNAHADRQFKVAAERAVWRTAQLPPPPNEALFERVVRFKFKP